MKNHPSATSPLVISRVTVQTGGVRTGVRAGTLMPPLIVFSVNCPPVTQPR